MTSVKEKCTAKDGQSEIILQDTRWGQDKNRLKQLLILAKSIFRIFLIIKTSNNFGISYINVCNEVCDHFTVECSR